MGENETQNSKARIGKLADAVPTKRTRARRYLPHCKSTTQLPSSRCFSSSRETHLQNVCRSPLLFCRSN